eukprot:363770-Chlamydomonas_euryale.AAC.12
MSEMCHTSAPHKCATQAPPTGNPHKRRTQVRHAKVCPTSAPQARHTSAQCQRTTSAPQAPHTSTQGRGSTGVEIGMGGERRCDDKRERRRDDKRDRWCDDKRARRCDDKRGRRCDDKRKRRCDDKRERWCDDKRERRCDDTRERWCDDKREKGGVMISTKGGVMERAGRGTCGRLVGAPSKISIRRRGEGEGYSRSILVGASPKISIPRKGRGRHSWSTRLAWHGKKMASKEGQNGPDNNPTGNLAVNQHS